MSHIAPIKATVVEAVTKLLEEVPKTGVVSFKHLTKGLTDRIEIVVKFLAILGAFIEAALHRAEGRNPQLVQMEEEFSS